MLVLLQTMSLPGQFAHMAQESPDIGFLRWPLTAVSVFLILTGGAVLALLMVVMRALLAQATRLRIDMDEVI